jgi:hypothetical protein
MHQFMSRLKDELLLRIDSGARDTAVFGLFQHLSKAHLFVLAGETAPTAMTNALLAAPMLPWLKARRESETGRTQLTPY